MENAYSRGLDGKVRDARMNHDALADWAVAGVTEAWRIDSNTLHPYSALGKCAHGAHGVVP